MAQQNQLQDEFERISAILPPPPRAVQGSHCHPHASQALTVGKLERLHRKQATRLNWKLFQLWEQYNYRDISTSKLLKKCSELYGPVDIWCSVVWLKYLVNACWHMMLSIYLLYGHIDVMLWWLASCWMFIGIGKMFYFNLFTYLIIKYYEYMYI